MIDYTNTNVSNYINKINQFKADMNGTEILQPLKSVLDT